MQVIPSIIEMVEPEIYPAWDQQIIALSHLLLSINCAVNYLLYTLSGRCSSSRRPPSPPRSSGSTSRRTTQFNIEELQGPISPGDLRSFSQVGLWTIDRKETELIIHIDDTDTVDQAILDKATVDRNILNENIMDKEMMKEKMEYKK